jgi:replicative DNA helicase
MRKVSEDIANRHYKQLSGIPTGFDWLDEQTGGYQSGDLILIAGRPGSGKTAFECGSILEMAKKGIPVLAYALEGTELSLGRRLVCLEAKVNSLRIRLGVLKDEEKLRIQEATSLISALPIYINDSRHLTVSGLRSSLRKMIRDKGIQIVCLDHWHHVGKDEEMKFMKGYEILQAISRKLKILAEDLNIPFCALAQLSRVVARHDIKSHRPMLSDLREAGEQDADLVLFMHREEQFPPNFKATKTMNVEDVKKDWESRYRNKLELIIGKHRDGPLGCTMLEFEKEFAHIHEYKATDEF